MSEVAAMKILSAIILVILFLITSPFFIVFFGGAELYKLYEDTLKNVYKRLDEAENQSAKDIQKDKR